MKERFSQPPSIGALMFALAACMAASLVHAKQMPPQAPPMTIAPDKPSGVYQVGDTVQWTVHWNSESAAPPTHYVLMSSRAAA